MLDTPAELIGSLIVWLTIGFAMWKGGRPERVAALGMLLAWLGTVVLQNRSNWIDPQYGIMAVDGALLVVLLWVALRTSRRWALFATAVHLLGLGAHISMALDLRIESFAYLTTLAIWTYGVLLALFLGTLLEAMPERRRLRASGATG